MTASPLVLVLAATDRELALPDPAQHDVHWQALCCGVGPVDAAAHAAQAIATLRPAAVLHVGIAGARRARALPAASLVIGTASHYCDLAVPARFAPSVLYPDAALLGALQQALPHAAALPIGTSARVGGTSACDVDAAVEAMEGFGVLRAAQLAGIPAIEVRAISNEIEETDRSRWHFDAAFAAITQVTPQLVRAVADAVSHTLPHAPHRRT